jgi:hypothetical protein
MEPPLKFGEGYRILIAIVHPATITGKL